MNDDLPLSERIAEARAAGMDLEKNTNLLFESMVNAACNVIGPSKTRLLLVRQLARVSAMLTLN